MLFPAYYAGIIGASLAKREIRFLQVGVALRIPITHHNFKRYDTFLILWLPVQDTGRPSVL